MSRRSQYNVAVRDGKAVYQAVRAAGDQVAEAKLMLDRAVSAAKARPGEGPTVDYEAIERLLRQQSTHHVALHPDHVRPVDVYLEPNAFAEAISGDGREIAVLEEDDALVAAAIIVKRDFDLKYTVPRRVAHVHEIVVDGPARRRGFGRALLEYVAKLQTTRVSHSVTRSLRNAIFAHLCRLSPAFHARHKTGDLLVRLMGDVPILRAMLVDSTLPW